MCKKIKEKLKGKLNKKNMKLLLYIICLLVFTSVDYILYVNWIDSMKNYPLESYVTHVSHGSLQGAPEKITLKKLSLHPRKFKMEQKI